MMSRMLVRRNAWADAHATTLELFYDLVFVFAITQVSHLLLTHLTWRGAGEAALVLMVVWWSWNYTTWTTNELDPEELPVRLLLIALMLASLLMAIAIPDAFGHRALLFACSYVAIQVGRHAFLTFVAAPAGTIERERAGQILIWFAAAGVFWIGGGLAGDGLRVLLWLIALAIDYTGPVVTYLVPGRKRLHPDVWQVGSSHFAERFQLFIILALGETIVITGASTSGLELGPERLIAFAIAFLGTAAFWWLFFASASRVGERQLEAVRDRTTLARDAYTYLHGMIAAGIIVAAVGDELVIAHPTERLPVAELVAVVAGQVIYLVAQALFRRRVLGAWSRAFLAGVVACGIVGLAGTFLPAMIVAALLVAVLVGVIAGEHRGARDGAA